MRGVKASVVAAYIELELTQAGVVMSRRVAPPPEAQLPCPGIGKCANGELHYSTLEFTF